MFQPCSRLLFIAAFFFNGLFCFLIDNIKQNAAILISNTILQSKEPGLPGEMANSKEGERTLYSLRVDFLPKSSVYKRGQWRDLTNIPQPGDPGQCQQC